MTKIALSLFALVLAIQALPAHAQAFPEHAIKLVAPFPPGGFTDVVTRKASAALAQKLGQPVVVENKPGAGTNIGTESVVRASADGYTLLVGTSSLAINPTLYPRLNYHAQTDLKPVGMLATTGYTLIANKDFPAATVTELIAYAKANPGGVAFGSSGNGAVNHLAGVLFTSMAHIDMQHVPYRGSQAAITDLLGGRIQLFWASTLEARPLVGSGRVKALGVTNAGAVDAMSGVPPIGQTVPGYEVLYWMGLFAPAATPDAVVQRLAQAVGDVAGDPELRKMLTDSGGQIAYMPPSAAAKLLEQDTRRWSDVVKASGAKVE